MLQWALRCIYLFKLAFCFLQIYTHKWNFWVMVMVVLFLCFWGIFILFSTVAAPIYIPLDSVQIFPFLHILTNICLVSSVAQSCSTLCDPMNCSTPGLPVHHQLPEFTQTHFHRVGDAIQPSHPLSSSSPPVPNPSQHHSLFQRVNSSHEVAKVLEFQL